MQTDSTLPALETLVDHYEDPERAAREHKSEGGKVVGYLSNNVPVELIIAAGLFPVEIKGDPHRGTEAGDIYMEPFHDGHIRSIFSRALAGEFNYLDLLVIPRSSEGYLQLYYYLLEAKKWQPELRLPEIHLFDLLQTPFWISGRYDRKQIDGLKDKLTEISGLPLGPDDVRRGIETVNASRARLEQINSFRREFPPKISGTDMLRIIRTAGFTDRSKYNALLDTVLENSQHRPGITGPRLMVKGTQHDSTDFYALLEDLGAVVVADDHFSGERSFEYPVETHHDSHLEAITRKYQQFSASPRSYPQSDQDARFIQIAKEAAVDAVIFYLEENDDTFGWDYPGQKRLLDEAGIPSLYLKYQPYFSADHQTQRSEVTKFLQQIESAPAPAFTQEIQ
ncbi:2-hydroxyacyl-CoA dehydratase family protein [Pseudarthrobacter sp. fls2-241-R2A-168]|uniref:2-hydroxyacyl-CoA dehydratase subunit D n=1 Tax=Pseudarthrobacter sp. fls2-241-R2A-168 TaxID=3040304 RepID=UPI002555F346|nr:2-hydroxyacyl-CoA dehydratase family protein [Pseudarthrobacter sp. fls2-241-R2A-168]